MNEKLHSRVSPPSKGGEMYQIYIQFFIFYELTAVGLGGKKNDFNAQ
jgi:hypothetical protein